MNEALKYQTNCLLCGKATLKNVFGDDHFITKCTSCSFVFSRVIPSIKKLEKHYDEYPLENKVSEITLKRYNEILDLFEPYRQTGRLLEFGCGEGYFLEVALKRNWKVVGIEISDKLVKICKDKNILTYKTLSQIPSDENNKFDMAVSIEVIEHLNDPKPYMQEINSLLRNGGGLYMTTPNFNCLSRFILGKKWNNIVFPEHLCYYTVKTMKSMLSLNGFKEIKSQTLGISPARYKYALLNWKKTKEEAPIQYDYNEKDRDFRNKMEGNIFLSKIKLLMNSLFNISRLGESLKIFYIKK